MGYYKYKSRDVKDSQVDWKGIGTAFRTDIDSIEADRVGKRKALEANYQELKTKIETEAPIGTHTGMNEAMARFTADASAKALEMRRAMKNGEIDPSVNTAFMTNLKSSTQSMFEISKAFEANYAGIMERHLEGGVGASEELAYLESAELFNKKGEPFIGEDGQVYLAARVNGVLDKDNSISLMEAKAAVTQRVNKFDMNVSSAAAAAALGESYVEAVRSGKIKTIDDARNNPHFYKALEARTKADLSTPSALASMLLDNSLGWTYDISGAESEGGEKVIKGAFNSDTGQFEPMLTPEQEAEAVKIYEEQILGQIGRKETAVEKTQEWELNKGDENKKFRDNIGMASKLYSGDEAGIQAAREYFVGLDSKIKNILRTPDGVTVVTTGRDGATIENTISLKTPSGKFKTEADFIRSLTELTGDGNVDDALRGLGIKGTQPTTHVSTEGASRTTTEVVEPDTSYGDIGVAIAAFPDKEVTIAEAIASVNIDGEVTSFGAGDRAPIVKGYSEIVNNVLGNLSDSKTEGMRVGTVDDENDMFEIYLPGTMTGPVYLTIEEGSSSMNDRLSQVLSEVYKAANLGKTVTPNDLTKGMSSEERINMKQVYSNRNENYNGGDGEQSRPSGGGSATTLPSSNSSAGFNRGSN